MIAVVFIDRRDRNKLGYISQHPCCLLTMVSGAFLTEAGFQLYLSSYDRISLHGSLHGSFNNTMGIAIFSV